MTGLPSLMTQSTSFTVTQRSVVGPGTLTPQRRISTDGSPHAAVAWLLVFRSAASPIVSGSATIMGAQAAFAASAAGWTSTTGEQAARLRTETAAAVNEQRTRTYTAAFVCCIDQAYRGCGKPRIGAAGANGQPFDVGGSR